MSNGASETAPSTMASGMRARSMGRGVTEAATCHDQGALGGRRNDIRPEDPRPIPPKDHPQAASAFKQHGPRKPISHARHDQPHRVGLPSRACSASPEGGRAARSGKLPWRALDAQRQQLPSDSPRSQHRVKRPCLRATARAVLVNIEDVRQQRQPRVRARPGPPCTPTRASTTQVSRSHRRGRPPRM